MAKFLIQLLLPKMDHQGRPFPDRYWEALKLKLADTFGGVTAYTRALADGIWAPRNKPISRESIFVVEVMSDDIDEVWWAELRLSLERDLDQDEVMIRALPYTKL